MNHDKHRDFYSKIAGEYHALRYGTSYGSLFRRLHHDVLREILSQLPPSPRVLEVACGTGHTSELLRACGVEFIACDLTPHMLSQARQRVGPSVPFVIADAFRLPFPDGQFDALLSTRFMHLFPPRRQQDLLRGFVRLLKPGGQLIVDFDNFSSRWLLALPHLGYNLVRYRRLAPRAVYNRIDQVERWLRGQGCRDVRSIGVGGYHLVLPKAISENLAIRAAAMHRHGAGRLLAEQFVTVATRR